MLPETIMMVILRSFGTKVFKKDLLEYGFPLLEYFRPDGISQQWLEGLHSKRENWYKICYQLVSVGIWFSPMLEYGFPLLESV